MMKNKRVLMVVGGLILVLVLVAGAFTAVRLLAKPEEVSGRGGAVQVFEDVIDDGSGPVTISTIVEPSPDLPQRQPETNGVFLRREDNSVFVGTGNVSVSVVVENGETTTSADHSGPEIEVVLTRDTVFYQDVTEVNREATESVERRIQQEVRQVDSMAELAGGSSISVWGERRGDRVIAEVVVFGEAG
jgi:hypothetical protein